MTDQQPFTASRATDLGVALNEARLLAIEVDAQTATAAVWLEVLTLPPQGPEPNDRRRRLCLGGVSRVAVSYRDGRWDDPDAPVLPLRLAHLSEVIGAFGRLPVYGWEFFNRGQAPFVEWRDRLSLDVRLAGHGTQTVDLFQEDGQRILDVRIWFATLAVTTATGPALDLEEFVAGGRRWWDALYAGDARAGGHGIVPLRPSAPDDT
jgi:hypothetical protein